MFEEDDFLKTIEDLISDLDSAREKRQHSSPRLKTAKKDLLKKFQAAMESKLLFLDRLPEPLNIIYYRMEQDKLKNSMMSAIIRLIESVRFHAPYSFYWMNTDPENCCDCRYVFVMARSQEEWDDEMKRINEIVKKRPWIDKEEEKHKEADSRSVNIPVKDG